MASMEDKKQAMMKMLMSNSEYPYDKIVADFNEKLPELKQQDLSSKVVLVTGANAGIGYETTRILATMNPKKIVMACRSLEKGTTALNTIKSETKFNDIEVWQVDLASFESVKAFAKKFNDSGLPLDVLVSNAGFAMPQDAEWLVNENGYELTIHVNHIANMLLVLLLTPALKRSAAPRINVVTSGAHFFTPYPNINDPTPVTTLLQKPEPGGPPRQYAASKLLNVLFVAEYVNRCPYKVWICSSNPGYTDSQLGTKNQAGETKRDRPQDPLGLPMRSTYEGTKSIIYASVYPELLAEKNGSYITNMRISPARSHSQNAVLLKNTWNDTMNILSKYVEHESIEEWAWKQ